MDALPILSPAAKDILWDAFNDAIDGDPLAQGAAFALAFGFRLDAAPADVQAEFAGLAIEGEWAINEGRSEVRFLAPGGGVVQTIRGPLIG